MLTVQLIPNPNAFKAIIVGKFFQPPSQLFIGRLVFTHKDSETKVNLPDVCEGINFGDSLVMVIHSRLPKTGKAKQTKQSASKNITAQSLQDVQELDEQVFINPHLNPLNLYVDMEDEKILHCDAWPELNGCSVHSVAENGKNWIGLVISPEPNMKNAKLSKWLAEMKRHEWSLKMTRKMLVGLCH